MKVDFTPEQESSLVEFAAALGRPAEQLVKEAALAMLDEDARFRAAIEEGIAQADRGEFVEEDEMDRRFDGMLRS
jgi:predicted transcriptional regulator